MTFPAPAAPTDARPDPISARIDAVLTRALQAQRLVGTVVLVQQHEQARHRRAAGWADREAQRPMALDTVFRLTSASKPIVSAAALRLCAQSRLPLDEAVTRWLPDFRPRLPDGTAPAITLGQLLGHTAGLRYRFFEPDSHGPQARAGVSDGLDASGIDLAENLRRMDLPSGLSVVALTNTLHEGMSGPFVNELRDAVYQGLGA